jgi:hypothetical protein
MKTKRNRQNRESSKYPKNRLNFSSPTRLLMHTVKKGWQKAEKKKEKMGFMTSVYVKQ